MQSPRWSCGAYSTVAPAEGKAVIIAAPRLRLLSPNPTFPPIQDAARRGPDRARLHRHAGERRRRGFVHEVRTAAGIAGNCAAAPEIRHHRYLPTLITDTREHMAEALSATRAAIAQGVQGLLGIHLEGPFLNPSGRACTTEVQCARWRTTTSRWPRRCRPAGR